MPWHRVLPFLLFTVTCSAWSAPSRADVPTGTYEYAISHDVLGRVGTHVASFTRVGDDLQVSTKIKLAVKIAGVILYTFDSEGTEVWRDGRLISASSTTNDNGRQKRVSARAEGDRLIVEGPRGRLEAPQPANTVNYWNFDHLSASALIEPGSGRVYRVTIAPAEREVIQAMNHAVNARKYEVRGDVAGELWFDDQGTWVRMDFERYGSKLSVTLDAIRS